VFAALDYQLINTQADMAINVASVCTPVMAPFVVRFPYDEL
jgi:hypothetical protein